MFEESLSMDWIGQEYIETTAYETGFSFAL